MYDWLLSSNGASDLAASKLMKIVLYRIKYTMTKLMVLG